MDDLGPPPSWLQHLNVIISPETSPTNGPDAPALRTEEHLSYPVASDQLSQQLEAWSRVQFAQEPPAGKASDFFDAKASGQKKGGNFEHSFSNYFTAVGGQSIDPLLYAPFAQASPVFATDGSNMLIHPENMSNPSAEASPPTPAASATTKGPSKTTTKATKTGSKRGRKPLLPPDLDLDDPDAQAQAKAIEEDKRRRNTAASARFRIKKKEREQAMASKASILEDRVSELEKEVENLKLENDWLRKLVFQKGKESEEKDGAVATA